MAIFRGFYFGPILHSVSGFFRPPLLCRTARVLGSSFNPVPTPFSQSEQESVTLLMQTTFYTIQDDVDVAAYFSHTLEWKDNRHCQPEVPTKLSPETEVTKVTGYRPSLH